jgi:hypothetical protein
VGGIATSAISFTAPRKDADHPRLDEDLLRFPVIALEKNVVYLTVHRRGEDEIPF